MSTGRVESTAMRLLSTRPALSNFAIPTFLVALVSFFSLTTERFLHAAQPRHRRN